MKKKMFKQKLLRGLMTSIFKRHLVCLALIFSPIVVSASDQPLKVAHKPPILTTTAIIEVHDNGIFKGIVLIERGKAPFGKAIPGGKVEYGETVENAVRREMMEEVNLEQRTNRWFHVWVCKFSPSKARCCGYDQCRQ